MALQLCVSRCALDADGPESPFEDDDWDDFDPTPLETWILDDFDWDIEEPYPQRGDFWDDSNHAREDDIAPCSPEP